jgi:general L-amino acid transport system permease protein
MDNLSFVRTELVPQKTPPASEVGMIGWMRANLFSSIGNSILTLLTLYCIFLVIKMVLPWAVSPTWGAASLTECRGILHELGREGHFSGACWGVIRERWTQLLFGFYPSELYFRPVLAFIGLGIALAPVLFESVPKKLLWFTAIFPFLCFWLIWGGSIWLPISVILGFVLAVVAYGIVSKATSALIGVIVAILTPILWWLFLASPFASTLNSILPIGIQSVDSDVIGGFMLAVLIGLTGIFLSLPIGIVLALGRQSDLPILKGVCVAFIEFIRGVPLITLLFVASTLLNYFMPPGTSFDLILRVMIMVTIFAAAYMAEVVRGGLAALPKGQYEAADSLGLDYWKAQRLIIMPQALKISIPGIVSTFIGLFKDTTLVGIVGLYDPLLLSTNIRADQAWNGILWELYGFIAVIFFIFCFSMSRYSMYLERKLATGH